MTHIKDNVFEIEWVKPVPTQITLNGLGEEIVVNPGPLFWYDEVNQDTNGIWQNMPYSHGDYIQSMNKGEKRYFKLAYYDKNGDIRNVTNINQLSISDSSILQVTLEDPTNGVFSFECLQELNAYIVVNESDKLGGQISIDTSGSSSQPSIQPGLVFRWAQYWSNGIQEDPNDPYSSQLYAQPGREFTLFVYAYDGNTYKRVTYDDLSIVDSTVAQIQECNENGDATNLIISGFGETTLNYNDNGKVYSLKIKSVLPDIGLSTSPTLTQSTYVSTFEYKGSSNNTFYLVSNDPNLKITSINPTSQLLNIASVTLDKTNNYVEIKLKSNFEEGEYYNLECKTNTGRREMVSFKIKDCQPGLRFRVFGYDWNGNAYYENERYERAINERVYANIEAIFYFFDGTNYTKIDPQDIQSSNNKIEVYPSDVNPGAVHMNCPFVGKYKLSYTDQSGKSYSLDVNIALPPTGFYKNNQVNETNYITQYAYEVNGQNEFYFIWDSDFNIQSLSLDKDFSDIADLSYNPNNHYAKITLKDHPEDGRYYDLHFTFANGDNGVNSIRLCDGAERFLNNYEECLILEELEISSFTYRDANLEENDLDITSAVVSNGDSIVVSKNSNGFVFKAVKKGQSEIKLTFKDNNGKILNHTFTINVIDQYLDVNIDRLFYYGYCFSGSSKTVNASSYWTYYDKTTDSLITDNVSNKASYKWDLVDSNDPNTISYSANGRTLRVDIPSNVDNDTYYTFVCTASYLGQTMKLEYTFYVCDAYMDYVSPIIPSDVKLGQKIDITTKIVSKELGPNGPITTTPNDNSIQVEYEVKGDNKLYKNGKPLKSNTIFDYNPSDIIEFERVNDMSADEDAIFVYFYLDGEYTGQAHFAVGATNCSHSDVNAIQIVNEKKATCTNDGYTGDKVCQLCNQVITKGDVIKALGHKYTETLKMATCTDTGLKTLTCQCGDKKVEVLKANGHIYENGKCKNCGAVDPNYSTKQVTVVTDESQKEVLNKEATTITNTISQMIKEATKENANLSQSQLVDTVKKTMEKSNDKEIKSVVNSVSEETLEKIILAVSDNKTIKVEKVAYVVDVKDLSSDEVKKIESIAQSVAQYFDLKLLVQSVNQKGQVETLGVISEPTNQVTFTLTIPSELKQAGRTFYIVCVHNGKATRIEVKDNNDGTLSFTTGHFSTYALAYVDKKVTEPVTEDKTTTKPTTGDNTMLGFYASTAFVSLMLVGLCLLKKRYE